MAEFRMDVERDEGEPLGAQVDDQLRVIKIVASSLADGHLLLGDVIITVNETPVKSKEHLFQLLRYAHPRLRLLVRRELTAAAAPSSPGPQQHQYTSPASASASPSTTANQKNAVGNISQDVERLLRRRTGFEYLSIDIDWESNKHRALGIVLANRIHRVIVTGLKPGSLGEEKLKLLDRCIAINGIPVSDKDVAKTIIIQSGGRFNLTIERGLTDEAKKEFMETSKPFTTAPDSGSSQSSLTPLPPPPSGAPDPSGLGPGDTAIVPQDVLDICREHIMKIRESALTPGPGILHRPIQTNGMRTASRLLIRQQSRETFITSDIHPAKRVRHVPKADPENILPKENP